MLQMSHSSLRRIPKHLPFWGGAQDLAEEGLRAAWIVQQQQTFVEGVLQRGDACQSAKFGTGKIRDFRLGGKDEQSCQVSVRFSAFRWQLDGSR